MGYTLRQVEAESKFCQSLTVDALERAAPLETIESVVQQQGIQAQRERKLDMVVADREYKRHIWTHPGLQGKF